MGRLVRAIIGKFPFVWNYESESLREATSDTFSAYSNSVSCRHCNLLELIACSLNIQKGHYRYVSSGIHLLKRLAKVKNAVRGRPAMSEWCHYFQGTTAVFRERAIQAPFLHNSKGQSDEMNWRQIEILWSLIQEGPRPHSTYLEKREYITIYSTIKKISLTMCHADALAR